MIKVPATRIELSRSEVRQRKRRTDDAVNKRLHVVVSLLPPGNAGRRAPPAVAPPPCFSCLSWRSAVRHRAERSLMFHVKQVRDSRTFEEQRAGLQSRLTGSASGDPTPSCRRAIVILLGYEKKRICPHRPLTICLSEVVPN